MVIRTSDEIETDLVSDILKKEILKSGSSEIHEIIRKYHIKRDLSNLNDILVQHPDVVSFWNTVRALASSKVETLEFELDKLHARLSLRIKSKATSKVTEATANAMVITSEEYGKLKKSCIEAKEDMDVISSYVKKLDRSKDVLWTLSANVRAELGSKIQLKENKVKDHFRNKKTEGEFKNG